MTVSDGFSPSPKGEGMGSRLGPSLNPPLLIMPPLFRNFSFLDPPLPRIPWNQLKFETL